MTVSDGVSPFPKGGWWRGGGAGSDPSKSATSLYMRNYTCGKKSYTIMIQTYNGYSYTRINIHFTL